MTSHLLFVYSNPVEGKEDEYNDWYENTHLDEVLLSAGFTSAQRFEVSVDPQGVASHRYLAVYEVEGDDPQAIVDQLNADRPNRRQSDSLDRRNAHMYVFSPTGPKHT